MELRYPSTDTEWKQWNKGIYPGIPNKFNVHSGYYMVGCAKSGFDVYVAFTNQSKKDIWIEKTSVLLGQNILRVEDLVRIESDEEFNVAHRYFINQGLLDGSKNS